jgi:hypothetical protein
MVAGFGKLKMILNDSRMLAVSTDIPMDVPKVLVSFITINSLTKYCKC